VPDPFIDSSDDVPGMAGGLPEGRGAGWWDEFFADRAKPCPFFVEWPDENLIAWFSEGLLTPGRVLELGCGHGRNAVYLASWGCRVDAVDFSAQAISWAQERANQVGAAVEFQCCSIFDAAITVKVTDRRKDRAEKISTRLVRDHDLIAFEKLRTKDMVRKPKPRPDPGQPGAFLPNRRRHKAGLNRGILASCWGLLATRSQQKAAASGAVVIYVDPKYSSQECRQCGHVASSSRESQAVFRCVACGHQDHADANAAKNVLARGLASLEVPAQAPGPRGVRPRKTPANPGAAGTTRDAA